MDSQFKLFSIGAVLCILSCFAASTPLRASQGGGTTGSSGGSNYPISRLRVPSLDKFMVTFENIPSPTFGIINDIIRDDRGFLWFGTTRGLCKYDGYQVRVLANESPFVNDVLAIMRLDRGALLLATGNGLWSFDLGTEQFTPFPGCEAISEYWINAIVEDSRGTIWIGTDSHGLFGYNRTTKSAQPYKTSDGIKDDRITALLLDHSGELWIGTRAGGLKVLDPATGRVVSYRSKASEGGSLLSDHVTALCENDNHDLWIGTDRGLNVLEAARDHIRRIDLSSPIQHTIWSMVHDAAGRMWITGSDLEILCYADGALMQMPVSAEIARSLTSIRLLYPDPVASTKTSLLLWVGTRSGVNKVVISTNPFTNHIRNQDSLQLDRGAVLSFCQDRTGVLWVGLWGGGLEALRQVDGRYRRVAHFENDPKNPSSLPRDDVGALAEDRNGNLWIGTAGGLAMLDAGRKHMVVDRHAEGDSTSLASNEISSIHEDRTGTIWICTVGGLSQLVPAMPHRFKNSFNDQADTHPTGGQVVSNVFEDHLGNFWVATYRRGLNKRDANGRCTQFMYPGDSSGSGKVPIFTLTEDNEGKFWLGTGIGLVSFDPRNGTYRRFPISELLDAHIFGVAEDRDGDLWLSTGIGLTRFNPKSQEFERFDEKDGFLFKELFSDFFRDERGRLFAGGLDGFMEFSPEEVSVSSPPPEITITSVSVFDKEIPAAARTRGEVHLSHDQNFFSFSFAALDYSNPQRNRFAYKMEGVDKEWVNAGNRNYTSYANLDPGDYLFRVKGCNSNNVWNEAGTSISITITPPYWRTWWFRTFVAMFFGSGMYSAYRYRLGRLLAVERLRLRIADDLHDDVGSNLSTIAMVSRVLQRAPEMTAATRHKLAEIYDTAIATSEGMKDIVWFIKPRHDTLEDLLLRMKDTASSLLADVEHDFHAPANGSSSRITIDFRRNFFLAFKEILTNIVKHASATRVKIHVGQKDDVLEMVIHDNGRGFNPPSAGEPEESLSGSARRGNGLGSLRSRAEAIGGRCEITSQPGAGTTVKLWGKP